MSCDYFVLMCWVGGDKEFCDYVCEGGVDFGINGCELEYNDN